MYIEFAVENNDKDPKIETGDHVRISKVTKSFAKGYTPNLFEKVFVIKKVKNTVPWTSIVEDLNAIEIVGIFYEKKKNKCRNENQQS